MQRHDGAGDGQASSPGGAGGRARSLDPGASRVRVRTAAEGLLARFAHDLELTVGDLRGEAQGAHATLELPVGAFRVVGLRRGADVDGSAPSEADRAEIERRVREDVFAGITLLRVEGVLRDGGLDVVVHGPRVVRARATARGEGARVRGAVRLSLAALGIAAPRGPMNAFRVKDEVEVEFDLLYGP